MSTRKLKSAGVSPQLNRYASFEDYRSRSPLWLRLRSYTDDVDVDRLRSSIQHIADGVESISAQTIRWMPYYTLHDRRHLLNILGWIDLLIPNETLQSLLPLEIGLTILAVLTHDLGMALTIQEHRGILLTDDDTPQNLAYRQFAETRHAEELHHAEQLEASVNASDRYRGQLIRQHILSEFLRTTHATPTGERIRSWLNQLKLKSANGVEFQDNALFTYGKTDFEEDLVAIAVSHTQPIDWLRMKMKQSNGDFHRLIRNNERVNFAIPGLLLRLGDIMDFDASRTPAILYKHLGLHEDLGIDLSISEREWQKHLAIEAIEVKKIDDQPTLVYSAPHCPHPVVHKCIREFISWISEELRGAREELARQWHDPMLVDRKCELWLPRVISEIIPVKRNGRQAYIYEDIQFKLDQDEILQLLMGDRLYGDPSLCIRELLQNSLDACELRDLRLQLKGRGVSMLEPVDGTPIGTRTRMADPTVLLHSNYEQEFDRGTYIDGTGATRRLEIHLTWGFDQQEQRYWLQVEDNGCGMTEEVVKRYFTQIGKSYCRSAEFRSEQAEFRKNGLLATPISQFGIGFLSCFMLADRIEIQTRPADSHPEIRPARDITISGPGSLFWIREGTRSEQGTTIKLWLKTSIGGERLVLKHDSATWFDHYHTYFEREDVRERDGVGSSIDPMLVAAKWITWPRYPILVRGDSCTPLVIDDEFYSTQMTSFDKRRKRRNPTAKGIRSSDVRWIKWDWQDDRGPEATGTRVRLLVPVNKDSTARDWLDDESTAQDGRGRLQIAASIETHLACESVSVTSREQVSVRGICVPQIRDSLSYLPILAQAGTYVLLDLCGSAAPPLTTDRKSIALSKNSDYAAKLEGVFQRLQQALDAEIRSKHSRCCIFLSSFTGPLRSSANKYPNPSGPETINRDWVSTLKRCWSSNTLLEPTSAFLQTIGMDRNRVLSRNRRSLGQIPQSVVRDLVLSTELTRDEQVLAALQAAHGLALELINCWFLTLSLSTKNQNPRHFEVSSRWLRILSKKSNAEEESRFGHERAFDVEVYDKYPSLRNGVLAGLLQEAFFPRLADSWACLELFMFDGMIGDSDLEGPSLLKVTLGADGKTVVPLSNKALKVRHATNHEFDLVFPTPAVALGELRDSCQQWVTDRELRRNATIPFLLPGWGGYSKADCNKLQSKLQINQVYALFPAESLWSKPFNEWSECDWQHQDNLSAMWSLDSTIILWAKGTGSRAWMAANGQPADIFFDR